MYQSVQNTIDDAAATLLNLTCLDVMVPYATYYPLPTLAYDVNSLGLDLKQLLTIRPSTVPIEHCKIGVLVYIPIVTVSPEDTIYGRVELDRLGREGT